MLAGLMGILIGMLDWKMASKHDAVLQQLPAEITQEVDRWRPVGTFLSVMGSVASTLLTAAGIGLMIRRRWGAVAAIGAAVTKVPLLFSQEATAYLLRKAIHPMATRAGPAAMHLFGLDGTDAQRASVTLMMIILRSALPIFLIVWMARERIIDEVQDWE